MSWSISLRGTPTELSEGLAKYGDSMEPDGRNRREFDAARPHLLGLISLNFWAAGDPVLNLYASGSGSYEGDTQVHNSCLVSLRAAPPAAPATDPS